jgi:hypothetical protein
MFPKLQCINCNDDNTKKEAGTLDSKDEKNHQDHMERKQRGRQEKQKDKEDAQKYNHIHAATFDLEAVLPKPCSLVSQAYYKRKLSSYNFTVYSLSDLTRNIYIAFPFRIFHGGKHGIAFHMRMSRF